MARVGNVILMPVRFPSHTKCLPTKRNVFVSASYFNERNCHVSLRVFVSIVRCSWLNNWCWPGYCTGSDYANDMCTCAPGFSGSPKCLQGLQY